MTVLPKRKVISRRCKMLYHPTVRAAYSVLQGGKVIGELSHVIMDECHFFRLIVGGAVVAETAYTLEYLSTPRRLESIISEAETILVTTES